MQLSTSSRSALALALAGGLAACGGGGGHTVPPLPGGTASPGTASAQRATATFRIVIPGKSASNARRAPKFVSPATQSIQITVQGTTGSAGAEIDVNATSCPGGVCAVGVSAPVGADTFAVTTYDAPGGSAGSGHVLSSGSVGATIVAYQANVVNLSLGGDIASIVLALDGAYPATGKSANATLTVSAYDAAKDQIVGSYANPIALTAAAGLSLDQTSLADSAHSTVKVSYDGVARTALAITAGDGTHTASASIVPSSSYVRLPIPGAAPNDGPFKMIVGPDGNVYYGELGPVVPFGGNFVAAINPGRIGQINTKTGVVTEIPIGAMHSPGPNSGADPTGLLFVGNDLYFAEQESGGIGKIANAANGGFQSANYSEIRLQPQPTPSQQYPTSGNRAAAPRALALGSDGKTIYVATYYSHAIASFDSTAWPNVTPVYNTISRTTADLVALGGTIYFLERAFDGTANLGTLPENFTSATVPQEYNDTALPPVVLANSTTGQDYSGFRFMTIGPDGKLYFTFDGPAANQYAIQRFDPASKAFSALPMSDVYTVPDSLHASAVSGSTQIVYADFGYAGIGTYDTASGRSTAYPLTDIQAPGYFYAQDVQQTTPADFWFTMDQGGFATGAATAPPAIGHLALAQGWSVVPQPAQPIQIYGTGAINAFIFALAYAPGTSYTFHITATPSSICSVQQPATFANTYEIVGNAAGSCSVAITDQNQRTQTLSFQVTAQNATISTTRRNPR